VYIDILTLICISVKIITYFALNMKQIVRSLCVERDD